MPCVHMFRLSHVNHKVVKHPLVSLIVFSLNGHAWIIQSMLCLYLYLSPLHLVQLDLKNTLMSNLSYVGILMQVEWLNKLNYWNIWFDLGQGVKLLSAMFCLFNVDDVLLLELSHHMYVIKKEFNKQWSCLNIVRVVRTCTYKLSCWCTYLDIRNIMP